MATTLLPGAGIFYHNFIYLEGFSVVITLIDCRLTILIKLFRYYSQWNGSGCLGVY